MKKLLLAITFVAAATAFAQLPGQKNIVDVFGRPSHSVEPEDYTCVWMNGGVSYTARLYDIQADSKPSSEGDTIYFLGGTLHEGGLEFKVTVRADDGWMSVAEDAHPYKQHDIVEYRNLGGDELLLIRNSVKNTVKDVLRRKKGDEDLRKLAVRDLRELGLAGVYSGPKGEVRFPAERNAATGLWGAGETAYTFAEDCDFPALILLAKGKPTYRVKKTLAGLELTPMKPSADEEGAWEPDETAPALTLDSAAGDESRWPQTSRRVLTLPELKFYAGAPLAENLKLMRNEIFARHNYKFQSADMQEYFGAQPWYQPVHDDVTDRLSEIEAINLSLIQALEKKAKEDPTPWSPYF